MAAVTKTTFLVAAVLCTALGCGPTTSSTPVPEEVRTMRASTLDGVEGTLVVAAGDIACDPAEKPGPSTCHQAATARLARSYHPDLVLTLGDQQYQTGDLGAFRDGYARSWGTLRALTRPVPGNHEYGTPAADGYYSYFTGRQPGPPGWYAFDAGSWRVYALNSNCDVVDCAQESRWLDADMGRHPRACSLITMHHPRYSSAEHGSNRFVEPLWTAALRYRTDLALGGHDHVYERFRKMDASGGADPSGIRSFVVGTGGRSLYSWSTEAPGSVVRHNTDFGVLALRLGRDRYAWEYRTVDGAVVDSGSARCV